MQPKGFAGPEARSDAELLRDCQAGRQSAWNELVERYSRLVYSVPVHMRLPAADADDVFQNVFTILHSHLATIRDPACLSSWLITTARRETFRVLRQKKHSALDESEPPVAAQPALDDELGELEEQQRVRQALRQLGDRDRELLTALFVDGLDYATVSRRFHMSIGSIGPTRARACAKLLEIMNALPDERVRPLTAAAPRDGAGRGPAALRMHRARTTARSRSRARCAL